jgi:3,5-epimerase/4-reductase
MPRGGAFRAKSAAVSVTTTRVAVFGRGYLGRRLAAELANEAEDGGAGSGRARWEVTLSPADITDSDAVRQALVGADVAINAAGKTGVPNVDWCEKHPLETSRANVLGPLVLASACAASSTYLLQLGSGCIFYGDSPTPGGWREDDVANPSSTYSRTKYAADLALSRLPNVGIARLRMPIDHEPAPRNLITKLAGYPFVVDVANSVTVVDDLVRAVRGLVAARATGVFHVTNPGVMRHRELLELYRELVDPGHRVTLIGEDELVSRGLADKPRSNCVLASPRLDALGITLRPVHEALRDCMTRYAQALHAAAAQ